MSTCLVDPWVHVRFTCFSGPPNVKKSFVRSVSHETVFHPYLQCFYYFVHFQLDLNHIFYTLHASFVSYEVGHQTAQHICSCSSPLWYISEPMVAHRSESLTLDLCHVTLYPCASRQTIVITNHLQVNRGTSPLAAHS